MANKGIEDKTKINSWEDLARDILEKAGGRNHFVGLITGLSMPAEDSPLLGPASPNNSDYNGHPY